jgi:hypothetical protein
MTPHRTMRWLFVAVAACAAASAGDAWGQGCKPGKPAVSGTLAAPDNPCPPSAKAKAEPARGKPKEPDAFWSGVHVGGSVSTTTTIRGR